MDYPWLPVWARNSFHGMEAAGTLSDQERRLFTSENLTDFWAAADCYVSRYQGPNDDLGGWLIGSIIAPLQLHFEPGTKDSPSKKTGIWERQLKADDLINKAADLAADLADTLRELEETTRLRPEMLSSDVVYDLEKKLRDWPETKDLFSTVPGMKSQKSSWRDWLREAHANLQGMLRICPGDFQLREKHWVALVHAMIGEAISRESVQAALRTVNE